MSVRSRSELSIRFRSVFCPVQNIVLACWSWGVPALPEESSLAFQGQNLWLVHNRVLTVPEQICLAVPEQRFLPVPGQVSARSRTVFCPFQNSFLAVSEQFSGRFREVFWPFQNSFLAVSEQFSGRFRAVF